MPMGREGEISGRLDATLASAKVSGMTIGAIPPTRIISFEQLVQEADPAWNRAKLRPWIYQFSNGRRFLGRPDIYTAPADGSAPVPPGSAPIVQPVVLLNDGGVLYLETPWEFPVTSSGLLPGQIYWDGGAFGIVPGLPFNASQPPLYLGSQAWELLLAGAASLPVTNPGKHDLRLWNNGLLVCIDI